MLSRITPLAGLVVSAALSLSGCSDPSAPTEPRIPAPGGRTPPVTLDLLVSVTGPTVLNTGNANDFTRPLGMNAVGDAVATVVDSDAQEARVLRWPSSSTTGIDIGTEHATAGAINSSGQIGGAVEGRAMLWTRQHGGTYQLTPVTAAISTLMS